MVGFLVKDCSDCSSLEEAICAIDAVLAQYGKNGWQNVTYLTTKPTPLLRVRLLLYYRKMLEDLKWNQCFYTPYTFTQIVSRVNALTAGALKIPRRMKLQEFTTTTTTTTTSTSTTSTTSTTTSTTTSSTTSTSTSTSTSTTTTSTTSSTTSTSTSSTTSTTTTTTTTASPEVTITNNAITGGVAVVLLEYDRYPPNENGPVVGGYPVLAGQSKTASVPASFIPGEFVLSVDGDPFGYIQVTGSDDEVQCQNYSGATTYTFTNVEVNNSQAVVIIITDTGNVCTTTTTTTSTTTTTTTTP